MKYPKYYDDQQKQKAFINAVNCICNGVEKAGWNDCNIDPWESDVVWKTAIKYLYGY